ncbi:MAG: FHA domain-containing protein, partial [Candidatus Zixiibacteriota bacterium]
VPEALPSFDKKEVIKEDKTMFDAGKDAPAALPSFGKPNLKEIDKTSFESGEDAPAALPKFAPPKKEEETIASKAPESTLPAFQKKPDPKPVVEEERTEVLKQRTPIPVSPRPRFMLSVSKLNKEYELKEGQTTIGRTIGCDIIIDDVSMSRKHAMITVTGDKIIIKDLGSSNGSSVDKKKISTEVDITPSSEIRLGMVEIKIKKVV